MSYNIDHSEYLKGKLSIKRKQARILLKDRDELPEGNFLDELDLGSELPDDELLPIENFWWYGEGSGHAYEDILPKIVPHLEGTASIHFIWEGGDSQTAIEIKNGKMTKKKVKTVMEDE